jgi:hypothetical protein
VDSTDNYEILDFHGGENVNNFSLKMEVPQKGW